MGKNKERYNQIIDEAYGKFITEATLIKEGYENGDLLGSQPHVDDMFSNPDELIILTKEEFTEKCKTDKEFSKRWELKIEERGKEILAKNQKDKYTFIPNGKTSRTQSDMVDVIIGVNGKRRRYK